LSFSRRLIGAEHSEFFMLTWGVKIHLRWQQAFREANNPVSHGDRSLHGKLIFHMTAYTKLAKRTVY